MNRRIVGVNDLPIEAPKPCPICGAKVHITGVDVWDDDGKAESISLTCKTEPDIDSDEWNEWHRGHFNMPYVDWLPYELRVIDWFNRRFRWELKR